VALSGEILAEWHPSSPSTRVVHIALYAIQGEQGLLEEKGRYAVGQGPMWVVVHAH